MHPLSIESRACRRRGGTVCFPPAWRVGRVSDRGGTVCFPPAWRVGRVSDRGGSSKAVWLLLRKPPSLSSIYRSARAQSRLPSKSNDGTSALPSKLDAKSVTLKTAATGFPHTLFTNVPETCHSFKSTPRKCMFSAAKPKQPLTLSEVGCYSFPFAAECR